MKILLDECVPRKLRREFTEHEVRTVPQMGWSGKQNGELLDLMIAEFDVFITTDQNLECQQHLSSTQIPMIVMIAKSNRLEDLVLLVPSVKQALPTLKSREIRRIS